jgi:hypothetical protein
VICELCRVAGEDARLDGAPLCIPCVDLVLAGAARLETTRLCSRCGGPVRGGRCDEVPLCRVCVVAELERGAAVEVAPAWLRDVLPPLDERWRPRRLRPVELPADQAAEQLRALRKAFAETGRIVPPPPPRRHWLDD